ncbi:MAG: DUF3501 family protein [Bradymonadia bacterium]
MRKVKRNEVVDYQTYEESRNQTRPQILAEKKVRRVHVGEHLTFLFENHNTIRYQIQEIMRTEKIVKEADIQHEIQVYNELIGDDGELGCTLLVEIPTEEGRNELLSRWKNLNEDLYLKLEDGEKIKPSWDERQIGDQRLSSVQYLRFDTRGQTPIAVGCNFDAPELFGETALSAETIAAFDADLQDH